MHPGDEDRLAALLGGADLTSARAALARAAGPRLTQLAYLVLQNRSAAEAAAATALGAAIRRAATAGWRPTGPELGERLVADLVTAALQRYAGTHEVDPLSTGRPTAIPADPVERAVVVAVIMAGLPANAAARAAGMRESRARRIVRAATADAGSEERLRDAMAAQLATISLSVGPQALEVASELLPKSPRRGTTAPAVAGVTLALLLAVLAMARGPGPTAERPAASGLPSPQSITVPSPVAAAAAAEGLPTLAGCGIGPPDAELAFAGWLTVDQLGAAPPDAARDQPFYALVPAGDVAWNPPGQSRRIMPPVRGRLACLSTVTGRAPTVVGLPGGWTPPPPPRPRRVELADCGIHPADAPLAHRGWLLAEHLGGEPAPRPLFALVTADTVTWTGPTGPTGPSRESVGRFACVLDPDTGEVRTQPVASGWSAPGLVDGCPPSPLRRVAGNLELGGPDAFVLLPPVSTSWWANDPSVRIMVRLSPGPAAGSTLTAAARPLDPGRPWPLRIDYAPTPVGREPSDTHYVWLEDVVFPEAGCWVVSLAIDGAEVGWAVLPVRERTG